MNPDSGTAYSIRFRTRYDSFMLLAHWSTAPDLPIFFMGKLRCIPVSSWDSSNCWEQNVEQELCPFVAINSLCVYFWRPTYRWRDWRTWRRARFCSSRRCPGRLSALRPSPPSVRSSRLWGHFLLLTLYFFKSSVKVGPSPVLFQEVSKNFGISHVQKD